MAVNPQLFSAVQRFRSAQIFVFSEQRVTKQNKNNAENYYGEFDVMGGFKKFFTRILYNCYGA